MAHHPHYRVFRIVNGVRKEIYLVATSQSIFDAIAALPDERPLVL